MTPSSQHYLMQPCLTPSSMPQMTHARERVILPAPLSAEVGRVQHCQVPTMEGCDVLQSQSYAPIPSMEPSCRRLNQPFTSSTLKSSGDIPWSSTTTGSPNITSLDESNYPIGTSNFIAEVHNRHQLSSQERLQRRLNQPFTSSTLKSREGMPWCTSTTTASSNVSSLCESKYPMGTSNFVAEVRKRRRLSSEERLQRSRERNRMHAKKTRERKKMQMEALQSRIEGLKQEFGHLKQIVDARYTAYILLVMSGTKEKGDGNSLPAGTDLSSVDGKTLAAASLKEILGEDGDDREGEDQAPTKRTRRRGKLSPEEREHIRRERNRMHAKRTRDRKKLFLEESEQTIARMERENKRLRDFLKRHGMQEGDSVPIPPPSKVIKTEEDSEDDDDSDDESEEDRSSELGSTSSELGGSTSSELGSTSMCSINSTTSSDSGKDGSDSNMHVYKNEGFDELKQEMLPLSHGHGTSSLRRLQ